MKKIYFDKKKANQNSGASSFLTQLKSFFSPAYIYVDRCNQAELVFGSGESISLRNLLFCKLTKVTYVYRVDGRRRPLKHFKSISVNYFQSLDSEPLIKNFVDFLKNLLSGSKVSLAVLLADGVIYQSNFVKSEWSHLRIFKAYINNSQRSIIIHNAILAKSNNNLREFNDLKCLDKDMQLVYAKGVLPASGEFFESVINYLVCTDSMNCACISLHLYGAIKFLERNSILLASISSLKRNKVFLHGTVPRKALTNNYKNKVAFICLEDYSPCPNAVIEAYSHGLPCIGPNTGSFPELAPSNDLVIDYKKITSSEYSTTWLHDSIACASTYSPIFIRNYQERFFGSGQFAKYSNFCTSLFDL